MATVSAEQRNKRGTYYVVQRYNNGERYSARFYVPKTWDTWSKKAKQKYIDQKAHEIEESFMSGERLNTAAQKALKAENARREQAELEAQAALDRKVQTFKHFCETDYIPNVAGTFRENSRASYVSMLENHVYPTIGSIRLPNITDSDIDAVLLCMKDNGKAHATIQKVYNVISAVMEHAYKKRRLIPSNPMDFVTMPTARDDESKPQAPKCYTAEQIAVIWQAMSSESLQWRTYFALAADTGARRGELCGLKWADVSASSITIRRTLNYTPQKGIYENPPKTAAGYRTLSVSASTLALLDELKESRKGSTIYDVQNAEIVDLNEVKAQTEPAPTDYVFLQDGLNLPMHPDSPTRFFKRFENRKLHAFGIYDFHPHKLRHTMVSLMVQNGVDFATAGAIAGHASTASTLVYAHSSEQSRKEATETYQQLIKHA